MVEYDGDAISESEWYNAEDYDREIQESPIMDKAEPSDKKLTEEQIKNWRKVLSISYGPYALIMPEEEIRKIKNSMQMEINKCQPAQTAQRRNN